MRRPFSIIAILVWLAGTALADPGSAEEAVPSYRTYTLAADGVSLGLLVGGMALEGPNGRDTSASEGLMIAGLLGGFFATPAIHLIRGHGTRALGSWALRQGVTGAAMLLALGTASCSSGELLCGADRIGPAIVAGLVISSIIDASFLTNEPPPPPTTGWAPQIAPTRGGASFGVVATF